MATAVGIFGDSICAGLLAHEGGCSFPRAVSLSLMSGKGEGIEFNRYLPE